MHLALTSEWADVKWRPLTSVPSIVDPDGYFFPLVQPRPGSAPKTSIKESAWKIDEIERELRAQLTMAKKHLPQATYTWNHMGFTSVDPTVNDLVLRLSKEFGLLVPSELGVQWLRGVYEGKDSGAVKADKLAAKLETIGPGTVGAHRSRVDRRPGDARHRTSRATNGSRPIAARTSRRGPAPRSAK